MAIKKPLANYSGKIKELQAGDSIGGTVAIGQVSIPFLDGDTVRRVTINDASVTPSSRILHSFKKTVTTNDSLDKGYVYHGNIALLSVGSFDMLIYCTDWAGDDCSEDPPNESVFLNYIVV